jgi:hypothetical protein
MYKHVENNNKSLLILFSNESIVLILSKEQEECSSVCAASRKCGRYRRTLQLHLASAHSSSSKLSYSNSGAATQSGKFFLSILFNNFFNYLEVFFYDSFLVFLLISGLRQSSVPSSGATFKARGCDGRMCIQ